jgi:hypothetical protein
MSFTPAVLPHNSCKINYQPALKQDGIYQLIVQAKDRSDNKSGEIDYKINFEIVNRSTITEVMNYPNPFSTSTRFVFTLTGSEVPTYFKIQILTVSGKVVREITNSGLGPVHIGRNITEYAWDGKDQFGDQLRRLGRQQTAAGKPNDIASRLTAVAALDADADGVANEAEILLGHNPGNSNDVPAAAELELLPDRQAEFARFAKAYRWRPFETVSQPPVPRIENPRWARNSIDGFIAAAREEKRLAPKPTMQKQSTSVENGAPNPPLRAARSP